MGLRGRPFSLGDNKNEEKLCCETKPDDPISDSCKREQSLVVCRLFDQDDRDDQQSERKNQWFERVSHASVGKLLPAHGMRRYAPVMTAEESLQRAESLLDRLEAARARLEVTEEPEAALEILGELSEIAREVEAEIQRAKREAEAESDAER